MAYLVLYVDDVVLTASSIVFLNWIISSLRQEFAMTDLGSLHYFLGVAARRTASGLFLFQAKCPAEILDRAKMTNCNPCSTPIEDRSKLPASDGNKVADPTLYRSLVGALQYLTLLMQFNRCVSICTILVNHILPLSREFSAMSKVLWSLVFSYVAALVITWWHIRMRIGPAVRILVDQHQDIVSSLVTILLLGPQNDKTPSLILVPRGNSAALPVL